MITSPPPLREQHLIDHLHTELVRLQRESEAAKQRARYYRYLTYLGWTCVALLSVAGWS
jgi:hypothetical protein